MDDVVGLGNVPQEFGLTLGRGGCLEFLELFGESFLEGHDVGEEYVDPGEEFSAFWLALFFLLEEVVNFLSQFCGFLLGVDFCDQAELVEDVVNGLPEVGISIVDVVLECFCAGYFMEVSVIQIVSVMGMDSLSHDHCMVVDFFGGGLYMFPGRGEVGCDMGVFCCYVGDVLEEGFVLDPEGCVWE